MVTDTRLTDRIMKLRNDPTANAVMAAAYTKENAGKLAGRLGRNATEGELYVAHFLGSRTRLIAVNNSATCLNRYGERFLKRLRVAFRIVGARTPTPRRLFHGRAFR